MGISYSDGVITVTGGSQDDPFTMADLLASGTTSSQIATGGYGGNIYTVTGADLVIGSTGADTFFDVSGTIIDMGSGQYLTVYTTALRGGRMGPTFGQTASEGGVFPFTSDTVKEARLENIRRLYIDQVYTLNNTSGVWTRPNQQPRIVAVVSDRAAT